MPGVEASRGAHAPQPSGERLPGGELKVWYLEAYCRAGSTDRGWSQTVIPHETRLLERRPDPNQLVIRLDPSTGVRIVLDAHRADSARRVAPITFDVEFAQMGGEGATPYEVLLHAAMIGQTIRFTRQDGVEETWRIMQPLLDDPPPVHVYGPGTWGPEQADELVAGHGRWSDPWIES